MSGTIPPYLTDLDRWILWQNVIRAGKQTKIPISVRGGPAADVTDPRNWGSHAFCAAARVRTQGAWDGEGIVLGDLGTGEALVGLDLDSCLVDGRLAEWARPYLDALDTYAEVSPSGVGLKLFFRVSQAELPTIRAAFAIPPNMNGRKKTYPNGNGNGTGEAHGPAAEIYLSHRFFTVTGRQWHEAGEHVALIGLDAIRTVAALFGPRETTIAGSDNIGDATAPNPEALRAKLAAALRDRPYLAERWLGIGTGLTDTSRSGFDMSLGSMLKAAGFTYGEMRAAILANPHGAGPEHANDERYFERIWSRSVVPARPQEPEPPPHVLEGPTWESVDTEAERATLAPPLEEPELAHFPATAISLSEWTDIPPREPVYGHFLFRKFISAIGAPGGAGKTAYAIGIAFAVALGRNLLKEQVHEQGNVWIYNLEDPRTELLRRVKAVGIAYNVSHANITDRIFLDSGRDRPLVIAQKLRDGSVMAWPQVPALIAEIKRRDVRLLIVDPFVRSHRVEENHNDEIDFVAALWASVADQADCAILLVHHFKKGGVAGDAGAFRGASALIDASRAAVTLSIMSAEEAQRLGIEEKHRWQYVRVDSAKLNLAPPPESAAWLHLMGIDLGNATDQREADNVQAVERWEPPSAFEGISIHSLVNTLERLKRGPGDGEQFYLTGGTGERWAGLAIMAETGKTEEEVKRIIAIWKRTGLIRQSKYISPADRKERSGMEVDEERLQKLRRQDPSELS